MVKQMFHKSHFILYFLIILCLMSNQLLVQTQQVKESYKSQNKKSSLHSKKVVQNKRSLPERNVILDANSYYALLYVGGIMFVFICLMFFPSTYRKPYQYIKHLLKNSKLHSLHTSLKNNMDVLFDYIKYYIELCLNVINYKLIYKIILHLFQFAKSLIIVYSDKQFIYNWLIGKKENLSSEEDWDLEQTDSYGSSSPLIEFSRPHNNLSKNNSIPKNKKGSSKKDMIRSQTLKNKSKSNGNHKSEALLPLTNGQAEIPYRMISESSKSSNTLPPPPPKASNDQQNVIVNTMAMPYNNNQAQTYISPNTIPMNVKSRNAIVNVMDNNEENLEYSITSSNNTHAYNSTLPPAIPEKSTIDCQSVINYNPYSIQSSYSSPNASDYSGTISINEENKGSLFTNVNSSFDINDSIKMSSSVNDAGYDINPWTIEESLDIQKEKDHEHEIVEGKKKVIKGILVNKPVIDMDLKNEDGTFDIVNKKRGKKAHKHSLSFSVPLTSTIEMPIRVKSSNSPTNNVTPTEIINSNDNTIIMTESIPNHMGAYSNAIMSNRKKLRQRSISTPMPIEKESILNENESLPSEKKVLPPPKINTNVSHIRSYSTSVLEHNKLRTYADVLNSSTSMILDDDLLESNNNAEINNKKGKKTSKNANTRSNSGQTNNQENNKNTPNGNEGNKESSDRSQSPTDNNGNEDSGSNGSNNNNGNNTRNRRHGTMDDSDIESSDFDENMDHRTFLRRHATNDDNGQQRRSKRKLFFSQLMFVVALISTLALVLFVQLFGYILTAADQARGVTLRLSNNNRQQTVCDNNERTGNENSENGNTNENPSSSIPNAEPEVVFTEESPIHQGRNNYSDNENDSDNDQKADTETEEEEEEEEKEKEKGKEGKEGEDKNEKEDKENEEDEEDKEKNEFLAHLSSLRAAQAMAAQGNQNNPNRINDPTRINDPRRLSNPSDRLSSYLSNYVYYNSDIYSP